jgi:hypothetical protein
MSRDHERSQTDEHAVRHHADAPHARVPGGSSEFLLVATGFAMLLVGVAIAILPTVMPGNAWMVRSLAAKGLTSAPMLVGSFVLWGLCLNSRSSRSRAQSVTDAALSTSPAIDNLAAEVAHLGDGLQGLRIEFVYLKDALQSQQDRNQSAPANDAAGDAMYRLAASLDQVGARIEGRLHASHGELSQALQGVASTIEALKLASATPPVVEAPAEHHAVEYPQIEHAAEGSANGARLGLLDMLDDLGRLLPHKSAPVARPVETDPFELVQDEGWKHAISIPGALPAGREEIHLPAAGELLAGGRVHPTMEHDEEPLGDKLADLRDLLADARVREALASIERMRK